MYYLGGGATVCDLNLKLHAAQKFHVNTVKVLREAAKKVLFLVAGPLRGGGGGSIKEKKILKKSFFFLFFFFI